MSVAMETPLSFDEPELALLPKHTKVRVTGNNRTKSTLVGLTGVVKKAVGLGGWHLRLETGVDARVQRNAIVALSAPTGDESDSGEDDLRVNTNPNSTKPDAERMNGRSSTVRRTPTKPLSRPITATVTGKRPSRPSERAGGGGFGGGGGRSKVNFDKLGLDTLKKIEEGHYKQAVSPDEQKRKLVASVAEHFMKEQVDEAEVLMNFMAAFSSRSTSRNPSREVSEIDKT